MAKSPSKRSQSKKKRRGQDSKKKGTGLMRGMRGGFKNAAGAVTGLEDKSAKKKKNALVGTIVTIVLVALVAVFMMYR